MLRLSVIVVGFSALVLLAGCQQEGGSPYVSTPAMNPPVIRTPAGGPIARQQDNIRLPDDHPNPRYNPPAFSGPRAWAPSAPHWGWRWIVIHHSDTANGSAASFDRYHRTVRHWDELGYHFVIDNGNGGPDGRVEVGSRWTKQKVGAHAGVKFYNEYGIGICLVGDFDSVQPSPAQMRSLVQLTGYLMRQYHIPAQNVVGHHDIGRSTRCPGKNMSVATVRRLATAQAAMPWDENPAVEVLASRAALMRLRAAEEAVPEM